MEQTVTGFSDLYRRYAPEVQRFAYWLCGNAEDARDITSETFLRVWASDQPVRITTVKAYLFVIARNLFLQKRRSLKSLTALDPEMGDPGFPAERLLDGRFELERVLNDLQQLPEPDRSALILRAFHDLSYAEIAAILNLSLAATKVKIHRARARLLQAAGPHQEQKS